MAQQQASGQTVSQTQQAQGNVFVAASSGVGSYKEEREQIPLCCSKIYPHPPRGGSLGLLRGDGESQKSHFQGDGNKWVRPKHFLHCGGMDKMKTTLFYAYMLKLP